jgi:predicted kinase
MSRAPLSNGIDTAVSAILRDVGRTKTAQEHPFLLVLTGLPGTGKSTLAARLHELTGAAVLESDHARRLLFSEPTHSARESAHLFRALHQAADRLLQQRVSVIFDATNLLERDREPLYSIAEQRGARVRVLEVTAPEQVTHERLLRRHFTSNSAADWAVYRLMRARVERIQRPHTVIDTTEEIGPAVAALAKEMKT